MRRVIPILICFGLSLIGLLVLRGELGVDSSFAGDGGPDLIRMFLVMALPVGVFISGLIGGVLLWRLLFSQR